MIVAGDLEAPVRQHDDVVAVVAKGVWLERIDDQREVKTEQLLPARVAVRPVGPALANREAVDEVSPGAMPAKLTPGTPSMSGGRMTPCQ